MRRILLLTTFLLTTPFWAKAQVNPLQGHGAPSGTCVAPYTDTDTGNFYTCALGQFHLSGANPLPVNSPLPASSSGPGPVFNVKNYGAFGDSQSSLNATPATTVLNCTDCAFTSADVGKRISCATAFVTQVAPSTTITAVNSTTQVALSGSSAGNNPCTVLWGHSDDAACTAAMIAAVAQMTNKFNGGNIGLTSFAPTLYFPAGNYNLSSCAMLINPTNPQSGFSILGDGVDETKLYYNTGETASFLIAFTGQIGEARVENLTLDGANGNQTTANSGIVFNSGRNILHNVTIQRMGVAQGLFGSNAMYVTKLTSVSNSGAGIFCSSCVGEFTQSVSSNNQGANGNLFIQGTSGLGTTEGFHWIAGLIDECSTSNAAVQVVNSVDVWLSGSFLSCSGVGSSAISVDGKSYVHTVSGIASVFSNDPNLSGLTISPGGVVISSDFTYAGTGSGKCITNSGIFLDNGGNRCGNAFLISSGTSTGTAAVLTVFLKTSAPNTNCTVGDALQVFAASPIGYNGYYPAGATSGITAVSGTTISYTTPGSNLGNAIQSGYAVCLNLQSYSGNLPRALLNNPIPNTCYVTITPIVNATTYTMCNFGLGTATNITRIMASSQVTTTCATAPIVTISDGTVSETLTLTSAKSSWDSSVDASTGVGTTIFKPNGVITVRYDAGAASACATPPTQLAVSYNISPILSN